MTRDEFCKSHWEYYMVLEIDFLHTERYLCFDLGNNYLYDGINPTNLANSTAYSVEYIKQYLTICSEIDVSLKTICCELGNGAANTMPEYTNTILGNSFFNNIINQKVKFYDIELCPFANWSMKPFNSPDWWSPYNGVKHKRLENEKEANLKNVLNALAGLFVLENYLVKYIDNKMIPTDLANVDVPNDKSRAFEMLNWKTRWSVIGHDVYDTPEYEINAMFD